MVLKEGSNSIQCQEKEKRHRLWAITWFAGYKDFREEVAIMHENDKY